MPDQNEMATVSEVLNKLARNGMGNEFKLTDRGFSVDGKRVYAPEELEIVKVFRFEGISDPGDMSVIYIIQAKDGITGYSLNAYGMYSDKEAYYDNLIRQIPERGRDEQMLFKL